MCPLTADRARAKQCLAEAAAWRLISLLLERPRSGWMQEIIAVAAEVEDTRLREAADAASAASEGMHLFLFGEGGFVSPREVTYRPKDDPGAILADLGAFHRAFQYVPRAEDPPDHIAVQAGFMGYLALKEALALESSDPEAAEVCVAAAERFWAEHLSLLARSCLERLGDAGVEHLQLALESLLARGHQLGASTQEPSR